MSASQIQNVVVVPGTWAAVPSTTTTDSSAALPAQVITGTRLPAPAPVLAHTPRAQSTSDPIDDFFGVTPSNRGTQESRHDINVVPTHIDIEAPPPYADASDLPSYASVAEPPTLAMYLFKFGFLFPLFWLAGVIILLSPLSAPENWEPTKTEAERQELIALLRKTERKWAKRCLVAFLVFALIVLAISLTAVLVMRS
ncbi:hypothetical protein K474DRAFT_1603012 [Panus rudis PR-1116 ss-1]|nr:hypothetical protein K474DRAFT_1603012 [Panus rudis PR-1116 ss-1]